MNFSRERSKRDLFPLFYQQENESRTVGGPDADRTVWECNVGTRGRPLCQRHPIYIEESLEWLLCVDGAPATFIVYRTFETDGMYELCEVLFLILQHVLSWNAVEISI